MELKCETSFPLSLIESLIVVILWLASELRSHVHCMDRGEIGEIENSIKYHCFYSVLSLVVKQTILLLLVLIFSTDLNTNAGFPVDRHNSVLGVFQLSLSLKYSSVSGLRRIKPCQLKITNSARPINPLYTGIHRSKRQT